MNSFRPVRISVSRNLSIAFGPTRIDPAGDQQWIRLMIGPPGGMVGQPGLGRSASQIR
jgi:hypothetical protein